MTVPRPQNTSTNAAPQAQSQQPHQPTSAPDAQLPQLEELTESQYIAALAHLESLQNQLDNLRLVLPSIVHSLTTPYPDPQSMYKAVYNAMWGGSRALDVFRNAWEGPKTREVLMRVRASWFKDSDVSAAAGLPTWGWIKKDEEAKRNGEGGKENGEVNGEGGGEKEGEKGKE